MEYVQPIREQGKINAMKKNLLGDRENGLRNHLLFTLGINSGLRISDLLKLKLGDVLLGEKGNTKDFITLRENKTGKAKQFPINDVSKKAIKMYLAPLESVDLNQFVFKSRKGENKSISRVHAWEILNKAAVEIGVNEKIGTHSLRKTFGYHAYKKGVDLSLLQQIFNHSAPSVTKRYIGITQDDIDQVYINLNL